MNTRLGYFSTALAVCIMICMIVPQSQAQTTQVIRAFANPDSSGAFLGIRMTDVTKENMAEYKLKKIEGVIVKSVVEDSPAESAGIMENDVLLNFDGVQVRSTLQLSRLVRETPIGREVTMVVNRDGQRKNLTAQLAEQTPQQAEVDTNWLDRFFRQTPREEFNFSLPDRPERSLVLPAPAGPRHEPPPRPRNP